jgi:hypothetical protein
MSEAEATFTICGGNAQPDDELPKWGEKMSNS